MFFVDFFEKKDIIIYRMDTQKNVVMALTQVTDELAKNKFIVGAKQLKKALKNGNAIGFSWPATLTLPLQSPSPLCVS